MKIIGQVSRVGYIAEISFEEVDAIVGGSYLGGDRDGHVIPIGTQVKLDDAWRAIRAARDSRESVTKAAALLRAQADSLDSLLRPIIHEELPPILQDQSK